MEITVKLNPKHESYQVTAFYETLASSGHEVELVFRQADLLDQDAEPSLGNLPVPKYTLRLINSVTFLDKKGKSIELYRRVNNLV